MQKRIKLWVLIFLCLVIVKMTALEFITIFMEQWTALTGLIIGEIILVVIATIIAVDTDLEEKREEKI